MTQGVHFADTEFSRLAHSLPPASAGSAGEDQNLRARAMLSLVVDRVLANSTQVPPIERNPSTCPNCATPTVLQRTPYCSDACREEAGFVRQFRSQLAEGRLFEEERQVALGQVLWHLLGAGYPLRQSLITPGGEARVFKREEGKCELCGAPASRIDHTGSG